MEADDTQLKEDLYCDQFYFIEFHLHFFFVEHQITPPPPIRMVKQQINILCRSNKKDTLWQRA